MADLSILAGATSRSINIDLYVLSTGAPQTGLVFNSLGLTAAYSFTGANATATSITLATQTVNGAWSSGGFVEIDATKQPGLYRFDIPNAALASAKGQDVVITFTGFSGMRVDHTKIELTGWDNQLVPGAAGGMFIAGTNVATTISNASGVALTLSGGGASGVGLSATGGSGSGAGIKMTGGSTGPGMSIIGGSSSGDGIDITTTSGHGMSITPAGSNKHGINISPEGSGGNGITILPTGGHGINIVAANNAGVIRHGINIAGCDAVTTNPAGNGINVTGGAATTSAGGTAGVGLNIVGGAGAASTNGAAIGATIAGGGTNTVSSVADGLKLTGTSNGSGLDCILAGTGASITASTIAGAIASVTGTVTVGTINASASNIKKNTALAGFEFLMTDRVAHAPQTGLTVTGTVSLDGAAFGSLTNAVAEVGSGMYKINLAAADLNANTITLKFSATGADDSLITLITQP